ncbi:MAG: FAD-dependent oxidoreductase [Myxococcota bacterium]
MAEDNDKYTIAMVGAGPASLYSTDKLAEAGHEVVILNRDIKHGGLAEFGIYPTKYRMKRGLRKMFNRILERDNVHYFGNVSVGEGGDLELEKLEEIGFDAIVVAVGAQGTKWLGLPGEDAERVYHAKDLVYHYNGLPPYSEQEFEIGEDVCVIGLGNVCLDIVHWLICEKKVDTATAVARRGPNERKTTRKEMRIVSPALDITQLEQEFDRIAGALEAVGQDPEESFDDLTQYKDRELACGESPTRFRMRFLRSPVEIVTDEANEVAGLKCEKTRLVDGDSERVGLEKLGEYETIPCDTVVFAIGDEIEPTIGLPLEPKWKSTFATVPEPWDENPDRPRYMCYDPATDKPIWNTFVVGWARQASDGLVGKAKADGEQGCDEVLAYLDGEFRVEPGESEPTDVLLTRLVELLNARGVEYVEYDGVKRLLEIEQERAEEEGIEEFKFRSNDTMLSLLDRDSS